MTVTPAPPSAVPIPTLVVSQVAFDEALKNTLGVLLEICKVCDWLLPWGIAEKLREVGFAVSTLAPEPTLSVTCIVLAPPG